MFNYIAYRAYEYFRGKDVELAVSRTINFLALFQGSLIIPLFILINLITDVDPKIFGDSPRIKYFVGIPIAIILIVLNSQLFKKKLEGKKLREMEHKYHKEKYRLPIWAIFLSPVFFVFICPILYGLANGSIHIVYP